MIISDIKDSLERLQQILISHQSDHVAWLASLIELCDEDELLLYKELNSKHMWGGAGSVANEALADNKGIDEWVWHTQIQAFREIMIELGRHLMKRGSAYPDISPWLLAFSNWNQSDV